MSEKKLRKLSKKGKADKGSLKDQAAQIWLAGLGAFARAQEEGSKIFDALVREGREIESEGRKVTNAKVNEVRGAVEGTVGQIKERASKSLNKFEQVFEDRVARALGGLGVPTAKDVQALNRRVDELQKAVEAFKADQKPAARKTTTKKATTKKTAAKKASAKKATAKKASAKKTLRKKTAKKSS